MSERLIYFHGMPGGPDEWALCAPGGVSAIVLDRNPAITASELAALLRAQIGAEPVVLIGFSLGVPPALAVAADLGDQVTGLHLISPAAPLQLGDFLDRMAGGPLFRLALSQPWVFRQIVRVEAVLARLAADFLFGRLFASAEGKDLALRADPEFRRGMSEVLRKGLGRSWSGFAAEVTAYGNDWRPVLTEVNCPVTIWQGGADNWTPPEMGAALAAGLPGSHLEVLDGCSHYSALKAALRQICL